MASPAKELLLGGRYRLLDRLAAGGMETVWEAEDTVLHRRVAVKMLSDALSADERFVERFRREARAAAGLSHPNVASVFDYGEDGDTRFIVLELIPGQTLAERLAAGPLPWQEAVRIARGSAGALQAAHDAGIVHRDVKPGNIMLTPSGDVKVMDFGIAAAAWDVTLTGTGAALGTASYISPEQASGGRATPASDVYSLGIVLFEMLAGRPPFTGATPVAVASSHVQDPPPRLAPLAPDVPDAVIAACERALEKDPARRPASASAFAAMLSTSTSPTLPSAPAVLPETAAADPPTMVLPATEATEVLPAAPRSLPPHHRSRVGPWLLIALLALLLVAALALGGVFGSRRAPTPTTSTVTVPPVVGLPLTQAKTALAAVGLRVAAVKTVQGPQGVVRAVQPGEGAVVARGGSVTLSVGGSTTTTTPTPTPTPPTKPKHGHGGGTGNGNGHGGGGD